MLRQAVKEAHLCGGPDRRWLTASLHFIYDIKELPVRACLFPPGLFSEGKKGWWVTAPLRSYNQR